MQSPLSKLRYRTMRPLLAILTAIYALVAATTPDVRRQGTLDDLRADALYLLNECDGVERAERSVAVAEAKHRIIHILDLHAIPFDDLAADLRDQAPDITDDEIRKEYRAVLATARIVQRGQRKVIRWLAKYFDVRSIHLEGLSENDLSAYLAIVRALGKYGPEGIPVEFGAAAQALVAGDLLAVLPAEDEAAFKQADPFAAEILTFHGPANDAREAAIVRRLVANSPLSVIILGAAHDLSRHARAVGDCEYLRVFVDGFPE